MKIFVDDTEIFTVSELMKRVIGDLFTDDCLEQEIRNRIKGSIEQLYFTALESMRKKWAERISCRYELVPTNADKYAEIILSQKDYRSRSQIETQSKEDQRVIREAKERAAQEKELQERVYKDSKFVIQ
jgi:maltooligosyltrehalose synthase